MRIWSVLLAAWILTGLTPNVKAEHEIDELYIETIHIEGQHNKLTPEVEQALTPGAVTLIDSSDLQQRSVASMADMLRYVPGIWVADGATGDSTFFSSRGSNLDSTAYDGNGIKLLQDGLPVTAADGNNHNRLVDPLSIHTAVVARGANALSFGASTLGGAINFISPTARDTDSSLSLNGGSYGQRQARLTTTGTAGDLDGLLTLESKHWDGFRQHQQQKRYGLYGNAGWQISDRAQTRFYATYVDNKQEMPGVLTRSEWLDNPYQGEGAAIAGHYQVNVESWRLANNTQWHIDANSSFSAGFSYEEQSLFHPIVYNPFFSLLIDTEQRNAGAAFRYSRHWGTHNVLLGLDYSNSTVTGGNYTHHGGHKDTLTTQVDNKASSVELFLLDRWQLAPHWRLVYGLQAVIASRELRHFTLAVASFHYPQADYQSVNPRLGLIYQWGASSEIFANISRLYEPPTNYELEDNASEDQQPLRAMHGSVVEIGARGDKTFGQSHHWQWELALYYGQLQNEILSVDDPKAPGTSLATNIDDTIHGGVEALVRASFALDKTGEHRLEPLLNLTINRFSFDDDPIYRNQRLPAAPDYAVKGEFLYRHSNGFFFGPTFDLVGKRYADFTNTYTIDAHQLLGLRMGLSGRTWEVYAEARNLTDKQYISLFNVRNQAEADAAILQPGAPRSFYMGVKIQF